MQVRRAMYVHMIYATNYPIVQWQQVIDPLG